MSDRIQAKTYSCKTENGQFTFIGQAMEPEHAAVQYLNLARRADHCRVYEGNATLKCDLKFAGEFTRKEIKVWYI